MAKRLIIPSLNDVVVATTSGELSLGNLQGAITYLVVSGPAGAPDAKGTVKIVDEDNSDFVIWRDPKPGENAVLLDFYNFEMRIPVNGNYKVVLEDLNKAGTYQVYVIIEERGRNK